MKEKKWLCLLAVALWCLGLSGTTAYAQESDEIQEVPMQKFAYANWLRDTSRPLKKSGIYFYQTLKDGTVGIVSITADAREKRVNIKIPSKIAGGKVTMIGASAFNRCRSLKSITFPKSVKIIGCEAFIDCRRLKSVTLPNSLKGIGPGAFEGCTSLKSITLPKNLQKIDPGAFSSCISLESITIPKGVKTIGGRDQFYAGAFEGCRSLKSITISEGVKNIGDEAFLECTSLERIKLPEGLKSIGAYAFSGTGLTDITIPKSVNELGSAAFQECKNLNSVSIPKGGITVISSYLFRWCTNLKSFKIPKGVKSIGRDIVYGCENLESVMVPESVEHIDELSFRLGDYKGANIIYGGSRQQWYDNFRTESAGHGGLICWDASYLWREEQVISAKNITKTYEDHAFSLGASALGGAALTYAVSDARVATVDSNGKVTINGCGITKITVIAAETNEYDPASKTITLTVKPKKAVLSGVKSAGSRAVVIKWKRDAKASGFILQLSTDKNFKKNIKKVTVNRNTTLSQKVKKLEGGKKYYVRVCSYVKSDGRKIQGSWSSVKTVKVKN